jgi:hypothetical protein
LEKDVYKELIDDIYPGQALFNRPFLKQVKFIPELVLKNLLKWA